MLKTRVSTGTIILNGKYKISDGSSSFRENNIKFPRELHFLSKLPSFYETQQFPIENTVYLMESMVFPCEVDFYTFTTPCCVAINKSIQMLFLNTNCIHKTTRKFFKHTLLIKNSDLKFINDNVVTVS